MTVEGDIVSAGKSSDRGPSSGLEADPVITCSIVVRPMETLVMEEGDQIEMD